MGDMDFNENEQAEQPAPEKRKLNLPILKILMIAGIVLAALVVGFFLIDFSVKQAIKRAGAGGTGAGVTASEDYVDVPEAYEYYEALPDIQTRTLDKPPASVTVNIAIGFEKGNKAISNEFAERKIQLQDFLRYYFSSKTAAELSPENEGVIKEELKEQLNNQLSNKGVRDIAFLKKSVIEQ